MILDLTGRPLQIGDEVVYTTKTEAPGLRFGVIEDIVPPKDPSTWHHEATIKIRETTHEGEQVYDYVWEGGRRRYTDKKMYSRLRSNETTLDGNDNKDYRLWVTKPI